MKQNQFTGDRDDRRHTSMDSDENDYQGQGLHIVGEESSKVSSVLCPYALHKFEFDEGNLRFDSLVENEVFLGIPSQDDNQWIEDFSRGSSGIDFSSSAPDSCSIPRHINVWSEATSSESVEMLLKSVGQEDMVLDESVVRDSNARNDLPSSNQMDTNFTHDSKLGDFKDSSCGTPPVQFQEDFSPLNKVEPEYISSSHGFDQAIDVCAGGVGESTTEQNLPVDVKGDDENASNDGNLIGESFIDKIPEDNIAMSCLSSDPNTGSGILSVQNKVPDISLENLGLPVQTNIVGSHGASDIGFVLDNGQVTRSPTEMHTSVHSAVCVASETEVWSEKAVKTMSNIDESPMLPPQDNSGFPMEEVFSPELAKADGCVALTEGTGNEPHSETKVLCGETAGIKVDEGCSREQSSVVSEMGNECGNEQSFAVSNNDQYIICPELEKEPVTPMVMSGRVIDVDDVMGVHGASDRSFMLDDGQATESPTQMHTSVSAAYVDPEMESLSENADKSTTNIEQSPMLPPQDNSTLHTEEGCKSGLFSPDLTMVSIGDSAASIECTNKQLQSESTDLCGEKVDDGCCSSEQSSVVSEIGNACGNEQSFAASNNDQCFIYPELKKQSVVPKVTSDGDADVFISSNSSKDGDHVEPAEAEPTEAEPTEAETARAEPAEAEPAEAEPAMAEPAEAEPAEAEPAEAEPAEAEPTEAEPTEAEPAEAEPAEAVQEPNDIISFNAPQEGNDGNPTSDLVNKNSKTHEVFIISCDSTQSVDNVQPTEATTMWERNDETLASESGIANSERDEASFNRGDVTKSVDHLESTEASPSLKLITGMSAEQDSHDRKPLNVMQTSNDESLTSDAIHTNFKIVLPVDDVRSSINITEENVGSAGGGPDFGLHSEGETVLHFPSSGSNDEVRNFPSVPVGADAVVKSIHQNEDQISQTMPLEASISDNKEDKKDIATLEASMEDIDEKMKQGPDAIVVESASAFSTAETDAKDVNQSMNLVELHGGQTNVEQVMTEVGQLLCGAESVSPPAFSTAETKVKDVNQSMNIVELHGGQTNVEQVMAEVGQEPCGAESVPLQSDSVVRERDGADSKDLMNLKGVTKGGLTLSGDVSGSINSVAEHYIDSAPVVSVSEISSNEGKTQSCMTESKDKDVPPSNDANVVVANLSSSIPSEGLKVTIEKDSSEGAEGTLKEDRTFTFPAGLLPVLSGKETSPVEGSHSTHKPGQTVSKVAQETPLGSPQMHDPRALSGGPKGTSERKTRRGSGKPAKGNPAKGNFSKEAESKTQRDVGNTLCVVLSPSATVKPMPSEAGSSANSSNLPDLNTSTSTAVLFRQPFTDLQQVQLRAQIFVYGSLIQGAAPDEACMVSAFGTSDGGRSIWEPAWRACIQRLQKSQLSNPETPVQSRSGAKASDQVTKTGLSQRKSRVSSNGNSSSVVTPIIPLSSPLWNLSTPSSDALPNNTVARSPVIDYQTLPPLHGYQTPASRNYSGHTRVSQAPFPVPWMASPQASPYNVNAHIAPPQPTEIVKLTTVKASPAPSPATMHASLISVGQNGHSGVVCSPPVLQETKKVAASYAPHSADPKSRKRKKVSVSEDLAQIAFPVALGRTESVSVSLTPAPSVNKRPALGDLGPSSSPPGVQVENVGSFAANSQFLVSATIPIPPGPGLNSSTEKAIAVVSPVSSVDHSARSNQLTEKRALSLDEPEKVDAKLQEEQASAHAFVVSPVVDHPASSIEYTEKRALILDEVAKVDAKLQAEQASAHAAVISRSVDHPASSRKRALSLDEVAKVKEAKLQAEQASAHAAAAVSHCQNVWSQLGKQNSLNLMPDSEAKLASAAVCIAAAASVAKAASAAAKVASTVALQAKLMADEALITNRCIDAVRNTSGFANEAGSATPASILKAGEGGNGSSSIICAAREAARKRIEAASAASKHAENLDAIVKAAELAAEAVAQAGKIVALGDPLPLSKLVEGGPAGYWKDTGTPFSMGAKPNIVTQNNKLVSVEQRPDPIEQSERPLDSMSQAPVNSVSPDAIEKSKDLMEDQVKGKMATCAVTHGGELDGLKSPGASKTTKTVGVAPESESGLRFAADENMADIIKDSRISVSSLVEVFKDNGDLTGAWFSASVLSLKGGKALVSYKDLETDQGRLTEWVPLEAGTRKPPVIRLAHPMTSLMFDGNRKRRREVAKDYSWSVGDRVDAWLENCWSEGVVVEKNKKDDTTISVHFPAQGKTIPVKAWHLRPSLIWTDGEWIESLSSETDKSSQGDTPKEKRMKLGSPTVDDGKGKEKITKIMDPPESRKFEESRLLPLSAKEKSFHIGSTKNDKPETHRTMRSGIQKEGPKVVFGVPKPGKKRKFMDVSKHYVSSQNTKANANIDKEKSAKHLVPEGGAYGWKYSSKVDVKERQAAEPRTRNFKPTKPPSSFTRTIPQKDKSLIPSVSGSKEGFSTDDNRTDATSNDDSSDQHLNDFVSSSNIEGEEPISSSSRAPLPRAHRKMTPSNAISERLMKGKSASAHGKPNKVVEKEKSVTDSSEPRRSNRKIQPTSRLLEGLQSSLLMSKTPLVSHEKSHKGQKFGPPRGMRS